MTLLFSLSIPATAAMFELGTIRQATRASPHQYVVPIAVDADGYSTFSTRIVSNPEAMKIIEKWESVERDQGVDVVITTRRPVITPQKIVVIAQYQGRERARKFWLQPVVSRKKKDRKTEGNAMVAAVTEPPKKPRAVKPGAAHTNATCRNQSLVAGTLLSNLVRILANCRRTLGHWPLIEADNVVVDFRITTPPPLPAPGGLDQLFEWLRDTYGIIPESTDSRYGDVISFVEQVSWIPASNPPPVIDPPPVPVQRPVESKPRGRFEERAK